MFFGNDMFWEMNFNNNIAPEELVYTDIVINNDKKGKETAKLIWMSTSNQTYKQL